MFESIVEPSTSTPLHDAMVIEPLTSIFAFVELIVSFILALLVITSLVTVDVGNSLADGVTAPAPS